MQLPSTLPNRCGKQSKRSLESVARHVPSLGEGAESNHANIMASCIRGFIDPSWANLMIAKLAILAMALGIVLPLGALCAWVLFGGLWTARLLALGVYVGGFLIATAGVLGFAALMIHLARAKGNGSS